MKGLMVAIVILLSALFILIGSLIYLNRDATALWQKFIPAITLAMVGACFTLWFSLKKHEIDITFPATFISHKKSGVPLELVEPRFPLFYGGKSFQARGFLRPLKDQDISKFHLDLALIEIAEILYSTYQEFTDKPGTDLYSSSKYPTSLSLPRQALDWPTFVNKFKCTDKLEEQFDSMNPAAYVTMNATIPKGTAIEVSCNKNYSRSLTFKNKFSAINIQIYQSHGRIGTGEWQWLFDYDTKQNEEFWSSTMSIHLSAKFEKLLSGNPDMPLYIEWAESIFENIQTNLDSKQQIDLARDKHHLYKSKIDSFLKENKQSNNTTGKQKVTPVKVEGRSK